MDSFCVGRRVRGLYHGRRGWGGVIFGITIPAIPADSPSIRLMNVCISLILKAFDHLAG